MANSNNVLRGGLTSKHVDMKALLGILTSAPCRPDVVTGVPVSGGGWMRYPAPFREFTLYRLDTTGNGGAAALTDPGAAIVAVTRDRAALIAGGAELILEQGESAFIPRRQTGEAITVRGACTVFAALAP
jgi:mannose-6-phosphate isomerase